MNKRGKFALLQVIIITLGLFSFVYLIGQEIRIVGAQDDMLDTKKDAKDTAPTNPATPASTDINSQGYVPPPSTTNTPSAPVYTESIGATLAGAAPIFTEGSVLGPGTYTSGTIGGQTLKAGQTAAISRAQDGSYMMKIKDAKGSVVSETASKEAFKAGGEVTGTAGAPSSTASEYLGFGGGSGLDALASGLQWAVVAYMGGQFVGGLLGFSDKNTEALSTALAAGAGSYKLLSTWSSTSNTWAASPWVGAGIAAIVFVSMYKDEETKIVKFDCMPWQAPTGGENCEVCNDDDLPCSEYRCRSLGQSCEIVNEGTVDEKCVYVSPNDVNPPIISPNYDVLTAGHMYKNVKTSPPGPGFEIVNTESNDGCLNAFTDLKFGLTLNEPAQCKIDFNHTESFEDMRAYVGGSNLYLYNHSEKFNLPGAKELSNAGFVLENGKDMTFFMRCSDKNGNTNEAEYALRLCVDPSPDTTPPRIEFTSVANGGCVAEDATNAEIVFYVNEPADCRWSFQDMDHDVMENEMICANEYNEINAAQLFGCRANLTGISRESSTYYVRCKDGLGKEDVDRNKNAESFEFSLKGSTGLILKNLKPNETVFGGASPAAVELYAETLYGCLNGRAVCSWSSDGVSYIEFVDTNNDDGIHTQRLDLMEGVYDYHVRCIDAGGNVAEDIASFTVDIDTSAPVIARVYEEDGMLKVVTLRDSECSYRLDNCDFGFKDGTEMPYGNTTVHVTEWSDENTYYIKCRDEFLNEEADCSIVVRPTANFL